MSSLKSKTDTDGAVALSSTTIASTTTAAFTAAATTTTTAQLIAKTLPYEIERYILPKNAFVIPQLDTVELENVILPPLSAAEQEAKNEKYRNLRKLFCKPEMILESGDLNLEYFKPRFADEEEESTGWGNAEKDLLVKGIQTYGVGAWEQIRNNLLPKWENNALRVKASRLIGRQNLKAYVGWKANAEMMAVERVRNKKIADATGRWKGSVLVADDDGVVEAAIKKSETEQPRAPSL